MIPLASISILAVVAFIAILMLQGWPNTAEVIAQWWLREAIRARRAERKRTEIVQRATEALMDEAN